MGSLEASNSFSSKFILISSLLTVQHEGTILWNLNVSFIFDPIDDHYYIYKYKKNKNNNNN